jgi:hypothetical protein
MMNVRTVNKIRIRIDIRIKPVNSMKEETWWLLCNIRLEGNNITVTAINLSSSIYMGVKHGLWQ